MVIAAVMGRISAAALAGDYRGCPFLNAAAEARRDWYHGVLRKLLQEDGDPTPALTASILVALGDGLLETAYLDDPKAVPALVKEALARLLARR